MSRLHANALSAILFHIPHPFPIRLALLIFFLCPYVYNVWHVCMLLLCILIDTRQEALFLGYRNCKLKQAAVA